MKSKHILAIGAHPGDMEISCGAVLAAHRANGNKVTIVHLTNGVENDSHLTNNNSFRRIKIEAEDAASVIDTNVIFGPYQSNKLKEDEESTQFITNLICNIHPTSVITHWKNSIQPDHKITHKIVYNSLLSNKPQKITSNLLPYNGVEELYFTENWEDREDFEPFIYIDVTKYMDVWLKMVSCYEQFKTGSTSTSSYIKNYQELSRIRGTESNFSYACTFNLSRTIKKQFIDILP